MKLFLNFKILIIIEILFPQLLNNLSASFKLLNQLKINLLSKLKEEIKNYNALLIKSISDGNIEKKHNESQAMLSIANKRIEEQKAKYEEKIKYNALFNLNTTLTEANEYYSSDHISLNNENKYLKDKIEVMENEFAKFKKDFEEMKKKLENSEEQRIKAEEQRVKAGYDFLNFYNSHHQEMVKYIEFYLFIIPQLII